MCYLMSLSNTWASLQISADLGSYNQNLWLTDVGYAGFLQGMQSRQAPNG